MYNNIKSCVKVNDTCSSFFPCNIGVRQGENLSPLIFSLYLNDLHDYIQSNGDINGIILDNEANDINLHVYLKLFLLLYCDDTIIMSRSADDLDRALKTYEQYCKIWKLTVNTSKSKIVVFSKGRLGQLHFSFNNAPLEIVPEYKYLGVLFCKSGSFYRSKRHIAAQGTRALYSLLRKLRPLSLPVDMQIDIFNKTVKPVLLYGSEIWGFGNIDIIERVQLRFLKHILNIRSSTDNCIVYGETGVYPIAIDIQTRIISYWSKLIESGSNPLAASVYTHLKSKYDSCPAEIRHKRFAWLDNVKNILTSCGFINIWRTQSFPNKLWLKNAIQQKLRDIFIGEWFRTIEESRSCMTYKLIKNKFEFETYLLNTPQRYMKSMIQFRTRNHKLPVETGRWNNTPYDQRKCPLCQRDIGDEFHYIFVCNGFAQARKQSLKPKFIERPNVLLFEKIINTKNTSEYLKLCKFIKIIIDHFRTMHT